MLGNSATHHISVIVLSFFFQAEDGIRDGHVTGVQTCALPISPRDAASAIACPTRIPPRPRPPNASSTSVWKKTHSAASPTDGSPPAVSPPAASPFGAGVKKVRPATSPVSRVIAYARRSCSKSTVTAAPVLSVSCWSVMIRSFWMGDEFGHGIHVVRARGGHGQIEERPGRARVHPHSLGGLDVGRM